MRVYAICLPRDVLREKSKGCQYCSTLPIGAWEPRTGLLLALERFAKGKREKLQRRIYAFFLLAQRNLFQY